jgi:predicted RNA binding protein YcfA (HicA-like mRNA interferase family)
MPKLPVVSGDKAIKIFEKLGYKIARQKGSHVRLRHHSDDSKKPLTIPRHKELGKGLLRKIARDAGLSLEELADLL